MKKIFCVFWVVIYICTLVACVKSNKGYYIDEQTRETTQADKATNKAKVEIVSDNIGEQSSKTSAPTPPTITICKHSETKTLNKKTATCTKSGYTGDVSCKDCNQLISKGIDITATGHKNTETIKKKAATETSDGYSGDTYCKDCKTTIATGTAIVKRNNNTGKTEYVLPDGTHVWVENVGDVTGYYMALKTQKVNHQYLEIEKEILRLCNQERAKAGLNPLEWFEDAYYFTKIRANECFEQFSHTRPSGKKWYTVYTDAGVYMSGQYGENLYTSIGISKEQIASCAVNSWMNSQGHKANILYAKYNRIAISLVQNSNELMIVQNFFS